MRKFIYAAFGLALLAAPLATAQTVLPVVNHLVSTPTVAVDQNGNAIGTVGNPTSVTCTSGCSAATGGATSANQTNIQSAPGTSATTANGTQGVTGGVPINTTPDSVVDGLTTTNTVSSAAVVMTLPMAGFSSVSFQVTVNPSNTVAFEYSNDNVNWTAYQSNGGALTVPITVSAGYVRARVSSFVSGNTTVVAVQKRAPTNPILGSGANLVGKVGIDQTTLGTTNGVVAKGTASLATGQVSIATTSTLLVAARTGRQRIAMAVTSAVQCAYGNSGVTLTTGWPLAAVAYATDNWDSAAAIYAVCASTATVAYREQF